MIVAAPMPIARRMKSVVTSLATCVITRRAGIINRQRRSKFLLPRCERIERNCAMPAAIDNIAIRVPVAIKLKPRNVRR